MGDMIGFGIYQTYMNRGSVGNVQLIGLQSCGWYWGSVWVTWARVWEGEVVHPVSNRVAPYRNMIPTVYLWHISNDLN